MASRSFRVLLGVGAAAALAACGSTVQVSSRVTGSADSSLGELGDGTGGNQQPTATSSGSSLGAVGSTTGTTGSAGTGALSTSTTRGTGGSASGPTAKPTGTAVISKSGAPVRVGVIYSSSINGVASALGLSGVSTGRTDVQAKTMVAYLNAKGGLAGHRIDLKLYNAPITASSNPDQVLETACTSLTEDQKVSYVVTGFTLTQSALACFAKHHVLIVDDASALPDDIARKYPTTLIAPGDLLLGRALTVQVDALVRTGWLTARSKIGTLTYDTAAGVDFEVNYLKPALARHGLSITVNARVPNGADGANQSGTALKFRSSGVDRVIPINANPVFLMEAAESQGYRPRYSINSYFAPGGLIESSAPAGQLTGARGIGWQRFEDIGAGKRPGPVGPSETLCLDLMRKAGERDTSGTAPFFYTLFCSDFFFLAKAADTYGLVPDLATLARSQSLPLAPTDTFGVKLAADRPDGAGAYRDLVYDSSCSCFQYSGGNHPT